MSTVLTVHPVLFALFVAPLALPAPARAEEPEPTGSEEPTSDETTDDEVDEELLDDLASPYLYIGAGAGGRFDPYFGKIEPLAKIGVGAGFYVPMLYLGGGADLTLQSEGRGFFEGFGNLGISIPVPVWHPLIGFKVGGGLHWDSQGHGTHLLYGPQVGWILRPYQKQLGLRAVVEALVQYYPGSQTTTQQVTLTFSFVL